MTFSAENLPPLEPGTAGHALPKPGAQVAACPVPRPTTMTTPWGQTLEAKPGQHYHLCADAEAGDHYPNDEFETFYRRTRRLDPEDDPRAAFLADYWAERGVGEIEIWEAEKTRPVRVVGVLAGSGDFETAEGPTPFEKGDVLLESPEIAGRMWVIRAAAFEKKYRGIEPGPPPEMTGPE